MQLARTIERQSAKRQLGAHFILLLRHRHIRCVEALDGFVCVAIEIAEIEARVGEGELAVFVVDRANRVL